MSAALSSMKLRTAANSLAALAWVAGLGLSSIAILASGSNEAESTGPLVSPQAMFSVESLTTLDGILVLARATYVAVAAYLLLVTLACLTVSAVSLLPCAPGRWGGFLRAAGRLLSRLTPGFVATILTSSLLSTGVAAASPRSDSQPGRDGHASDAPMMELVVPDPKARTRLPWGETASTVEPDESLSVVEQPPVKATGSAPDGERSGTKSEVLTVSDPAAGATATTQSSHVVVAGEHLWSIAASTLRSRLGQDPSLTEIDSYWRTLIEANRGNLADPDNPDFILPGQQLVLPG